MNESFEVTEDGPSVAAEIGGNQLLGSAESISIKSDAQMAEKEETDLLVRRLT